MSTVMTWPTYDVALTWKMSAPCAWRTVFSPKPAPAAASTWPSSTKFMNACSAVPSV